MKLRSTLNIKSAFFTFCGFSDYVLAPKGMQHKTYINS